jgi:hypothetical protein
MREFDKQSAIEDAGYDFTFPETKEIFTDVLGNEYSNIEHAKLANKLSALITDYPGLTGEKLHDAVLGLVHLHCIEE